MHPEIIRLGFLDYVTKIAPEPEDPLFPDLEPQGKDRKRGARFTRDFRYYREAVGVYREGVGMHAFRHTAITRLTNALDSFQARRHRDYMMGHSAGEGEGDIRYDKGPGLKACAETLALLRYPEIDLSHLYVAAEEASR
jgi:integrase